MCGWHKLQYNDQCCRMYSMYSLCGRDKEKCYLYYYGEHGVYSLRSRIHFQYHHERCDLYHLCCCLRSGNHLSIHRMYSNDR